MEGGTKSHVVIHDFGWGIYCLNDIVIHHLRTKGPHDVKCRAFSINSWNNQIVGAIFLRSHAQQLNLHINLSIIHHLDSAVFVMPWENSSANDVANFSNGLIKYLDLIALYDQGSKFMWCKEYFMVSSLMYIVHILL